MTIALPVVTNAEKQLGASRAASVGELGSYAQIYRNDGLLNDCHGRDRLNGVVADTAFHDLTTPELQHFDFGSLERSARKNDVGRFNMGKIAHGDLSRSLSSFRPQTIFPLENSDPFRTSLAPSNRVALNGCLLIFTANGITAFIFNGRRTQRVYCHPRPQQSPNAAAKSRSPF